MAIKYNNQNVKHLKYNGNYCHQVVRDGVNIWAETIGTLSKNYKTGLSNMIIQRNSSYEPSANIGELNDTATLYYGDSIQLNFTPANYYSVTPSSRVIKSITGTSPNEKSYDTGTLYTISRNSRTITVETPTIIDYSVDDTTFRVGVNYRNIYGSLVTTLCSYGTTVINDCWQGSTIRMYPRTTTSSSVTPYTAYTPTYAIYSAGYTNISESFKIYYPTSCKDMYNIRQSVYPNSSTYVYTCSSLSNNNLYKNLYMESTASGSSTNQLWVTGLLTLSYIHGMAPSTTTSFTTKMYQQYNNYKTEDYIKTLVTSSDGLVTIKGYQLFDGRLAVKVSSQDEFVDSISLYIQDVGIATYDMYDNRSSKMPKWSEVISTKFIYMLTGSTTAVDYPITVKNRFFSGKPGTLSNKFLLHVSGTVNYNGGKSQSIDKYLPFYKNDGESYTVSLSTLTGNSAIKSYNSTYTLVCDLYNQSWTDVIASEVLSNE